MIRKAIALLSIAAMPAFAQTQQAAPASMNAATSAIGDNWQQAHDYVLRSAEQLPDSLFGFRPVAGVRSFGELFGHVAGAEMMFCAAALGEKAPAEDAVEKSAKTKADLVKALKEAGTYCGRAYALSDADGAGTLKMFGSDRTRFNVLAMNATHSMEHYGNIVTYLRINGMVPPSSQPSGQ